MIACGRLYLIYVVKPKVIASNVAYAPTETQNASNTHAVWITLNKAVEEVLKHEFLFVLMDLDTRTGMTEKGVVGNKNIKSLDASCHFLNIDKECCFMFRCEDFAR